MPHWHDALTGLQEMRRVEHRVVMLLFDTNDPNLRIPARVNSLLATVPCRRGLTLPTPLRAAP